VRNPPGQKNQERRGKRQNIGRRTPGGGEFRKRYERQPKKKKDGPPTGRARRWQDRPLPAGLRGEGIRITTEGHYWHNCKKSRGRSRGVVLKRGGRRCGIGQNTLNTFLINKRKKWQKRAKKGGARRRRRGQLPGTRRGQMSAIATKQGRLQIDKTAVQKPRGREDAFS